MNDEYSLGLTPLQLTDLANLLSGTCGNSAHIGDYNFHHNCGNDCPVGCQLSTVVGDSCKIGETICMRVSSILVVNSIGNEKYSKKKKRERERNGV